MVWITASDDDKPILEEIQKQTDRAAALIASAYLEERLIEAIKARIVRNEDLEGRLFKGSGPMAAFAVKIDLGFMLGIYGDRVRRAFHTIREIRNEFAYKPQPRDFNSQRISDLCKNIRMVANIEMKNKTDGSHVKFSLEPDGTPRTDFLNAVKYLLALTDMETKKLPLRKPAPPIFPEPIDFQVKP
jgi:DNA-binding MltR family transcriptional regulator